jgi:hypothetical protein
MSQIQEVMAEFDLYICGDGMGSCDHGVCALERKVANAIITLSAERDALRKDASLLREIISSDSIAMTYQTMGQYRTALLRSIDAARTADAASVAPSATDVLFPGAA